MKRGISGKTYVIANYILLAVVFASVQLVTALAGKPVGAVISRLDFRALELVVKLLLWAGLSWLVTWQFLWLVMDMPVNPIKQFQQARQQMRESGVNSLGILIAGAAATAAVVIVQAQGHTLVEYLYFVLTRVTIGLAVAMTASIFLTWLFGARSMDDFRDLLNRPNDNDAILLSAVFILSMVITMSV